MWFLWRWARCLAIHADSSSALDSRIGVGNTRGVCDTPTTRLVAPPRGGGGGGLSSSRTTACGVGVFLLPAVAATDRGPASASSGVSAPRGVPWWIVASSFSAGDDDDDDD
eukprot:CAMPEP_0185715200 /NCGR_PEP_ID=MMETSP1164-20130828/40366_1 /TAXON_ID=1104430 /ORGANISM="Chrysoreinhardia sp, Strain CCMP2950" /LENGTH=110 /DNA_ID=CAMNT_0028382791 /DNA_START=149 /DNA_END=478 /DNA_ORIENTATION=-